MPSWLGPKPDKPKSSAGSALGRRRSTRDMSDEQEERVAKVTRGRKQPGSGAFAGIKGDVRGDALLVEAKTTDAQSLSIKRTWLDKISREAFEANKEPALAISLGDDRAGFDRDWIMVPMRLFPDLNIRRGLLEEDPEDG